MGVGAGLFFAGLGVVGDFEDGSVAVKRGEVAGAECVEIGHARGKDAVEEFDWKALTIRLRSLRSCAWRAWPAAIMAD